MIESERVLKFLFTFALAVVSGNAVVHAGENGVTTGQVHGVEENKPALMSRDLPPAFTTNGAVIQRGRQGLEYAVCQNNNIRLAFQFQQFAWKEYADNGGQLLKESGPLYGLHMAGEGYGRSRVAPGGTFKMNIFGGRVDYNGQTMDGLPFKTKTDYLGAELNGNLALRAMPADDFYVKVFAGPAIRFWRRDLNGRSGVSGYKEDWFVFDGRAGAGLDYFLSADLKLFAEGGCKIPFTSREEVDWSRFGAGRISLEPDQTVSPFAELGLAWKFLFVSGFYDSLRFDKSDVERKGGYYVYQPESRADIWGINAGIYARF